jgi:tetratricopeptide (TPR) repeat protein
MAKKPAGRIAQALALERQGQWQQAEVLLRKALAVRPDDAEVLYHLALLKTETGAFTEAHFFATAALEADPAFFRAHTLLGRIQAETGSPELALKSYDQAVVIAPNDAEAHFGRGVVLQRLERFEDALASYDLSLASAPDQAEVWCNHGNTLVALKRFEDAVQSFDRGLKYRPDVGMLHYNRASALNALGRGAEALAAYERALALEPGNVDFRNNRGNTRYEAGDHAGAMVDFQWIIDHDPDNAQGYNGLGMTLHDQGDLDSAEKLYERALVLNPDFADVHHNLAVARLYKRNFAGGWAEYEHRCDPTAYRANLRKKAPSIADFERLPLWKGPGHKVAGAVGIWYEQGIGDQILFSTMIPELLQTGQPFRYEVDARLLPAYQRAFPGVQFVALNDPPDAALTAAGAALFCGSLPGLFRPSVESFARQPRRILQAAPERVAHYRSRLGDGFKLALSWRSARVGRLGASKCASLVDFSPLLAVPGVRGIDVQYGDTVAEREGLPQTHGVQIEHVEGVDFYNDLDEVLAIIEACDLLITTSNANAHLAAALGKPVWLLYPSERAPFHYWAHGGDHRCLWYPSVEIISGLELTNWPQLVARAAERLRERVAGSAV